MLISVDCVYIINDNLNDVYKDRYKNNSFKIEVECGKKAFVSVQIAFMLLKDIKCESNQLI